jgi:hypothetical protein
MTEHTKYRVIFEDPDDLNAPVKVLIPSQSWLDKAMSGKLPPIWVYWALQDDEQQAIAEGRHDSFKHDPEKHAAQFTAPRIGPLTEEEAIEYLIMKDIPRHIWSVEYNRPMFKIVNTEDVPSDRQFRNAWRLAA